MADREDGGGGGAAGRYAFADMPGEHAADGFGEACDAIDFLIGSFSYDDRDLALAGAEEVAAVGRRD